MRSSAKAAPGLAAHLRRVDTRAPRVVVLLPDGVLAPSLGRDGRPCEAGRRGVVG